MRKKYWVLIFIVSITIVTKYASAKCPTEVYRVKGGVSDTENVPLANAIVSVFFDDNESGYAGVSSEDGKFQIEYVFSTYRGVSLFGDRCGKIPSELTSVVYLEGYFPFKRSIKIEDINIINGDNTLELPPIILIKKTGYRSETQ